MPPERQPRTPEPEPEPEPEPGGRATGNFWAWAAEPWRGFTKKAPQFDPQYWYPGIRESARRFFEPIVERMATRQEGPAELPQVAQQVAKEITAAQTAWGGPMAAAPKAIPAMGKALKAAYHDFRRFPPGAFATGVAEGGLKVVGGLIQQFAYGLERATGESEMRLRNTTIGRVNAVDKQGRPIEEIEQMQARHILLDQIETRDPDAANWVIHQLSRISWSPDAWEEQVTDPLTGQAAMEPRGKLLATRELADLWQRQGDMSYTEFQDATQEILERQQNPLGELLGQVLFDPANLIGIKLGKARDIAKMDEIAGALRTATAPKVAEEIAELGVKGADTLLQPFALTRGTRATTARRAFGDILSNAVVEQQTPDAVLTLLRSIRDNPDSLTHLGMNLQSEEGQVAQMILGEMNLDGKLQQLSLIPEGTPFRAADIVGSLIDDASEIANRIYNVDADVLPGPLGEAEKIVNRIRPYAGDVYIANPGQTFRNAANNVLKLVVGGIFGTEDVPSTTRWFDEKLGFVPQDVAQGFGRFEYGAEGGLKNFPLIGPWVKFWGEKMRGSTRFISEGWARATAWRHGTKRAKLARWRYEAAIPELSDELLGFLSPEQQNALRRGIEQGWKQEDFVKALDNVLGGRYVAAEFAPIEAEIPDVVVRRLQETIDAFQGRRISPDDFLREIDLISEDGFKSVLRHALEDVGTPRSLDPKTQLGQDGMNVAGLVQRDFEQSWARFYRSYGAVSDDVAKRQQIIDIWTNAWREQRAETSWYYMDSGQVPRHLAHLPGQPGVPGRALLDDAGKNAFWDSFRDRGEQRWLGVNGAANQADEVAGVERLKAMAAERMPKPTLEMMEEGWLEGTRKRMSRLESQASKAQEAIEQLPVEARGAREIVDSQQELWELSSRVSGLQDELTQLPNSRTVFRFYDYTHGTMRKVREKSGRVVDFEYSEIVQGIAKERYGFEESVEGAERFGEKIRRAVQARVELRGLENTLAETQLYVVPETLPELEAFIAKTEGELNAMADLSREPEGFETMLASLEEAYDRLAEMRAGKELPETIAAKVGSLEEEIAQVVAERKALKAQVEIYQKWDITHSPIKSATPQTSEVADIIYQDIQKMLQGARQTVMARPVRPGASPYAYQAGMRYIDDILTPALHDERMTWNRIGKWMADEALYDYTRRYNVDKLAALAMPYHFWPSREASYWLRRMFTKPWMLTSYTRFQRFLQQENSERPLRLQKSIRIPAPSGLPGEPEGIYVDLASKMWPFISVWPFNVLHYAKWGDDTEAMTGFSQWYDLATALGARPWFFLDIPYKAAFGTEEQKRQEWWLAPLTGGVKATSALLKEAFPGGTGWIPPGGINLETGNLLSDEGKDHMRDVLGEGFPEVPYLTTPGPNIRKFLGMMDSPWSEQIYWPLQYLAFDLVTDTISEDDADAAMLYFLVSTGQITEEEAARAMPEWGAGQKTWERSYQRGAVQRSYSTAGSFWLGQPVNIQTKGEAQVRKLLKRLQALGYDPTTRPEGTAAERRQMYEEEPALGVRQRAMDYVRSGPEALQQAVSKSQFWGRYGEIQEQKHKETDAYIRQFPGDTRRYDDDGTPRGLGAIDAKYDAEIQNFPQSLPSTYKMNPSEVNELQQRLVIQEVLKSYPDFEDFVGADGEPDYDAYNAAEEQFFADLETGGQATHKSISQAMRLYGGLSEEDATLLVVRLIGGREGIEQYWGRNDSMLEAVQRVYRDSYIDEAQRLFFEATQIEASGAKKIAIDRLMQAFGPVEAARFIPEVLERYKERGWTEQELREALGVGPAPAGIPGEPQVGLPGRIGDWAGLISSVLEEREVPQEMLAVIGAIMDIESEGNPNAVNSQSGATGLMQIMPMHFEEGQDPKDPRWNIDKGVEILIDNINRTDGDFQTALFYYSGKADRPKEPFIREYWELFLERLRGFGGAEGVARAGGVAGGAGLVFPGLEGYRNYTRTAEERARDAIFGAYDTAREEAGFPSQVLLLQDAYFASGESGSQGRRNWKQQNPGQFETLKAYWEWRRGYIDDNEAYRTLIEEVSGRPVPEEVRQALGVPKWAMGRWGGGTYKPTSRAAGRGKSYEPRSWPWWDWGPLRARFTWRV